MKKYQLNEVLPALNLSKFESDRLTETIKTSEEVNAFYPCQVFLNFSEQDGQEYYQHAEIKATYKGYDFYIKYWEHTKKYVIYEDFTRTLKNVDRYTLNKIRENIKEPQKIGVLNAKKLLNWFEYHLAVIEEAKKKDAQNGGVKEQFLKSIEGLPVKWWNEGKSGEIVKNGLKFSFTIGEEYITKKIEVYYSVSNELDNFLQLADNKYNK